MKNKEYRLDIQGLRAIAVLGVVLFHIKPNYLPGGFVGVDIFFVISGYLIIGHIWNSLKNNLFSFIDFYSRRIKRLFPALLFVLIVSSLLSWILLLPGEFSDYCSSLIYSLFYLSNFWFYSQSGYFDNSIHSSPLLHTWSLSVEEQFYVVAPLFLYFIFKRKWHLTNIFICTILASLLLSEALVHLDEALSFYASPSRFWQFLIGGFIAVHRVPMLTNKTLRECLSVISFLTLVLCMFFMSGVGFPGLLAILPTCAVAAIIILCKPGDFFERFLANPLFKFFGDISYSLYLWHWPVIIFYKLYTNDSVFQLIDCVLVFSTSVALGVFTFKYVESPIRSIKSSNAPFVPIVFSFLCTTFMASFAVFSPSLNVARFSQSQIAYEHYLSYPAEEYRESECFITAKANGDNYNRDKCVEFQADKYNILLIGDSHAAHWYAALNSALDGSQTLTQVTASRCKPVIGTSGDIRCTELINWAYTTLVTGVRFDRIILSARWLESDSVKLVETIKYLESLSNNIIVLGPIVEYETELPRLLAKFESHDEVMSHSRYAHIKNIDQYIFQSVSKTSAKYVSVLDLICPSEKECITSTNSVPVQFDYGHLTLHGAKLLVGKMPL